MKRNCRSFVYAAAAFLVCVAVLPAAAAAAGNGTISGTVLDERSHPVPHTNVSAQITNVAGPNLVPWAETDANGGFAIRHLRWGTYVVVADRPGAPFEQMTVFTNFYGRRWVPWATVSPQAPTATVALRLVPKFASLSGTIVSARASEPVTQAVLGMRRPGRAGASVGHSAPAHFTLLIPSEMVITLTVSAPGFEPWHSTVRMTPSERKALTIRLVPLASKPGTP